MNLGSRIVGDFSFSLGGAAVSSSAVVALPKIAGSIPAPATNSTGMAWPVCSRDTATSAAPGLIHRVRRFVRGGNRRTHRLGFFLAASHPHWGLES